MNILFDGLCMRNSLTGIGFYEYNLLRELLRIDNDNKYTVLLDSEKVVSKFNLGSRYIYEKSRFKRFVPWNVINGKNDFTVYHQPNYIPYTFNGRTIISIADMSYRACPQFHLKRRVWSLKAFEYKMKKADAIITISENAKQEIIKYLKIPEKKIFITYLGVNDVYKKIDTTTVFDDFMWHKWNISKEKYLLYVGTVEPRKNIIRLIKAFYRYKIHNKSDIKLVIAGQCGWHYKNVFALLNRLKFTDEVIFTGYFPEQLKPLLYNASMAVIYPSLYEGFGLPIIEAMACGKPVLTSNISAMAEIAGNAAELFNPFEIEDMENSIKHVLEDTNIRSTLGSLGIERAKDFSWAKCAAETLKVYKMGY